MTSIRENLCAVMAEQPAKDFEAGQKWLRSQRRIIIIREVDHDH